jgi:hypothetical protein
MRAITSGDLIRGSSQRVTLPVSAYGGRAMFEGTDRIGAITPGVIRPSMPLWQRL